MKKHYADNNGKNPTPRDTRLAERRANRVKGSSGVCSYSKVTAGWLHAAVTAVTESGGAILLGLSRDRGVFTVTILMDGDAEKIYAKASEGLDVYLEEIYHDFAGEPTPDDVGGD